MQSVLGVSASSAVPGATSILGSQVLTDTGTDLGTAVDVILEVADTSDGQCDVVGSEIAASEALGTKGTKVLIPLPDALAASGEHLMVPASAKDFVGHDLAGFGASVAAFRARVPAGRGVAADAPMRPRSPRGGHHPVLAAVTLTTS